MRMLFGITLGVITGYFIALGVYHATNSLLMEVVIGIPLVLINNIVIGKGLSEIV